MPGPYTRVHNSGPDDAFRGGGATDATVVINAMQVGLETLEGSQHAFRNVLINGQGAVSQRGATGAGATGAGATQRVGPDAWSCWRTSSTAGSTWKQLTTTDTLPTGFTHGIRYQRDSGNTSASGMWLSQSVETEDSLRFRGRPATLSFWARAGANFSGATSALTTYVRSGTGTDEGFLGYTGSADEIATSVTLTTSWQKFYLSDAALSSSLTELGVGFAYTPVGTAGAADYFDVTGIQLEDGLYLTPFEFRPAQVELALCQRRYWRLTTTATNQRLCHGVATAATTGTCLMTHPVPMRAPAALAFNGGSVTDLIAGTWVVSGQSGGTAGVLSSDKDITFSTGTSTVGRPLVYLSNTIGNYVEAIADL